MFSVLIFILYIRSKRPHYETQYQITDIRLSKCQTTSCRVDSVTVAPKLRQCRQQSGTGICTQFD